MTEPFLRALLPAHVRVCGRWLPPLHLWALAGLQAVASPLLAHDRALSAADLLIACRIARTAVLQPFALQPRARDLPRLWLLARSPAARLRATAILRTWLDAGHSLPELWDADHDSARLVSAPAILNRLVGLLELGISHREAWALSPGYATWLITAAAERHSDRVRFTHERDAELDDHTDAIDTASMTETAIIDQARADLPAPLFAQWLAARQQPATTATP